MWGMGESDPDLVQLERLRQFKTRPEVDLSLKFMTRQFKQQVAKPFKQLGPLAELWLELVPAKLVEHTKLQSLSRGVLRVVVDSSSIHYELDRLLRRGLEQQLISRHTGSLSRVRLQVGKIDQ